RGASDAHQDHRRALPGDGKSPARGTSVRTPGDHRGPNRARPSGVPGMGRRGNQVRRILFLGLFLLCLPAFGQLKLGLSADDLLEPEKAFRFSARAADAGSVEVRFAIADGYYMYRERFRFVAEGRGVSLGKPEFPPGIAHKDEFFGEMTI